MLLLPNLQLSTALAPLNPFRNIKNDGPQGSGVHYSASGSRRPRGEGPVSVQLRGDWIMTTSRQNAHKHVTRDHPGMQPRVERQQKRMRSSAHIENDGSPMQPTKVGALVFYRHVAHYHYRSHAWTISLDP